jgi:hypothetical protein
VNPRRYWPLRPCCAASPHGYSGYAVTGLPIHARAHTHGNEFTRNTHNSSNHAACRRNMTVPANNDVGPSQPLRKRVIRGRELDVLRGFRK